MSDVSKVVDIIDFLLDNIVVNEMSDADRKRIKELVESDKFLSVFGFPSVRYVPIIEYHYTGSPVPKPPYKITCVANLDNTSLSG